MFYSSNRFLNFIFVTKDNYIRNSKQYSKLRQRNLIMGLTISGKCLLPFDDFLKTCKVWPKWHKAEYHISILNSQILTQKQVTDHAICSFYLKWGHQFSLNFYINSTEKILIPIEPNQYANDQQKIQDIRVFNMAFLYNIQIK